MTKPLRVQRTVKTFTEDYGFQPRWSNRDQIYPSMLNIWKKKLDKLWINNFQILDYKQYGTMIPMRNETNEVSATTASAHSMDKFPGNTQRKETQTSDLLELKRHIWKFEEVEATEIRREWHRRGESSMEKRERHGRRAPRTCRFLSTLNHPRDQSGEQSVLPSARVESL